MVIRCCNDTYTRDAEFWRYPWGERVPGASDLALADLKTHIIHSRRAAVKLTQV